MNDQNQERPHEERLEALVTELDAMLAAGELDSEVIAERFNELFVPSEDIWFVHFMEVPFRMSLPDTGEFQPWVGVIIDAVSGDMIFAHTSIEKPDDEAIAMFLLANMIELGTAPAAVDIIDEEIGNALVNLTGLLGIDLGIPEEDLPNIREAMDEFVGQISEEDMRVALSEDEEDEG